MRLHRSRLVVALTAGLLLAGTSAALGQSEGPLLTAEEVFAQANPLPVAFSLLEAERVVRHRVREHVGRYGNVDSFGVYLDAVAGFVIVDTDASDVVLGGLVVGYAGQVRAHRAGVEDSFSRKSDTSPFYGASGVRPAVGTGTCSTGFTVVKNNTRSLLTAGHCYTVGQAIVTENGGVTVGTVTASFAATHDMATIGGQTYSAMIYMGGVDSTAGKAVLSATDPVLNAGGYCHSGRTTGEQCGHKVVDLDALACTTSGCKDGVVAYTGGTVHGLGDSGAPFFVKDAATGNVRVRGLAFARSKDQLTGYVEPYSRITAKLGVVALVASP